MHFCGRGLHINGVTDLFSFGLSEIHLFSVGVAVCVSVCFLYAALYWLPESSECHITVLTMSAAATKQLYVCVKTSV